MNLWMSGEIKSEVAAAHRTARKDIEAAFNSTLSRRDYGTSVKKLVFIAMIGAPSDYQKIAKFHKGDGVIELRQRTEPEVFKKAAPIQQRVLLCEAITRGLQSLKSAGDFKAAEFLLDWHEFQ